MNTPSLPFLNLPEVRFAEFSTKITEHGAIPHSQGSSTQAFSEAMALCAQRGGGTVIVPAGQWETGPIHFQSNVCLHLEKDEAVLKYESALKVVADDDVKLLIAQLKDETPAAATPQ